MDNKKGILYTSYFAKLNKGIGTKASVTQYDPKWLDFKKYNIKRSLGLAPSKELLYDYKYNNLSWSEYRQRYIREGLNNKYFQTDIKMIKYLLDKGENVTIYCYEKSTDNCHRHIIAEIFREHGYKSKEI